MEVFQKSMYLCSEWVKNCWDSLLIFFNGFFKAWTKHVNFLSAYWKCPYKSEISNTLHNCLEGRSKTLSSWKEPVVRFPAEILISKKNGWNRILWKAATLYERQPSSLSFWSFFVKSVIVPWHCRRILILKYGLWIGQLFGPNFIGRNGNKYDKEWKVTELWIN